MKITLFRMARDIAKRIVTPSGAVNSRQTHFFCIYSSLNKKYFMKMADSVFTHKYSSF